MDMSLPFSSLASLLFLFLAPCPRLLLNPLHQPPLFLSLFLGRPDKPPPTPNLLTTLPSPCISSTHLLIPLLKPLPPTLLAPHLPIS